MSVHTKMHPTKKKVLICIQTNGYHYELPFSILKKYRVVTHTQNKDVIDATVKFLGPEEVFAALHQKYTKTGALLKGVRLREGLTQKAFAKLIQVTQGDLSKMERGKRPIGKLLIKRIAKKFGSDIG